MLQEITIADFASYSPKGQKLEGLKPLNFIFGTNGTGKTTISRVIAAPLDHPKCVLKWAEGRELKRLVYNSDFVRENFAQKMPGIFTLGKSDAETLEKIEKTRAKVETLTSDISRLELTLGLEDNSSGKRHELRNLRTNFEETAWAIKGEHDPHFKDAFTGYRNSKSAFCDKILFEWQCNNSDLVPLEDLKAKARSVFEKNLARLEPLVPIDAANLIALEQASVLGKAVVGKDDIDIAALIRRLENSDWVRQGMVYAEQAGTSCPYCQQEVPDDLTQQLNDYFDETYRDDLNAIDLTRSEYAEISAALIERLEAIAAADNPHVDKPTFRMLIDRFRSAVRSNLAQIEKKYNEPSTQVILEGLTEIVRSLSATISIANEKVNAQNAMVENINNERSILISQIWLCLINIYRGSLNDYETRKTALNKIINDLISKISEMKNELEFTRLDLAETEKKVTSVEPTVNSINEMLKSFGFTGFRLHTTDHNSNLYEIVRNDGREAARTLSEGESSFITFLYFYHTIKGSMHTSEFDTDRVVVFDDPVSSLDSDVLFIISTLIRRIAQEACEGTGNVKQVFILTHNIYFHKEVSFEQFKDKKNIKKKTFWITKKKGDVSEIKKSEKNPISTSYQLLWDEIRSSENSKNTIQNTLRRILETYFKIFGNIRNDTLLDKLDKSDRIIGGALLSWANAGSHSFNDDLYMSADGNDIDRYLWVFKKIFEVSGHIGHYEMMMADDLNG